MHSEPITVYMPMMQPSPIFVLVRTTALSPMTAYAPTETFFSRTAVGAITAVECMPDVKGSIAGVNRFNIRRNAIYGSSTRIKRSEARPPMILRSSFLETRTAVAFVVLRYFSYFELARNVIQPHSFCSAAHDFSAQPLRNFTNGHTPVALFCDSRRGW